MSAPRIGVDVVTLTRAAQLAHTSRRAVLKRMLTAKEIDECTRAGVVDTAAVAGRLAVKEAVFKLLRAREAVLPWHAIMVSAPPGTWPEVRLNGRAADLAAAAGLLEPVDVSLAHDGDYAIGVATAVAQYPHRRSATRGPIDEHEKEYPHA